MAMRKTSLVNKWIALMGAAPTPEGQTIQNDFLNKLAEGILYELTTNGVISGAVTVASVSGVTTGAGVSGPGSGTMSAGKIA